jgi:hypothetical protein
VTKRGTRVARQRERRYAENALRRYVEEYAGAVATKAEHELAFENLLNRVERLAIELGRREEESSRRGAELEAEGAYAHGLERMNRRWRGLCVVLCAAAALELLLLIGNALGVLLVAATMIGGVAGFLWLIDRILGADRPLDDD